MNVLLVAGSCNYNLYQEKHLREIGVDARIFGKWGMHLPEWVDPVLAEKPDIIHLQWPEAITRHQDKDPAEVVEDVRRGMETLKASGAKLFWVMHNLLPHRREKTGMWRAVYQIFAEYCDVACHHSRCGLDVATAAYDYGETRHEILRHGYFDQFTPCRLNEAEARERLGLPRDARVYLSVGVPRPDKKLPDLLDVFGRRDPEKDVLVLAGNASMSECGKEVLAQADRYANVVVEDAWIEDDRVSLYAKACDAFLYMYGENHLTSGSPHMSQAFLLPQICLDLPYAREVLADGATYVPGQASRCARLHDLLDHFDKDRLREQREYIAGHRRPWNWSVVARETKTVYEEVLDT